LDKVQRQDRFLGARKRQRSRRGETESGIEREELLAEIDHRDVKEPTTPLAAVIFHSSDQCSGNASALEEGVDSQGAEITSPIGNRCEHRTTERGGARGIRGIRGNKVATNGHARTNISGVDSVSDQTKLLNDIGLIGEPNDLVHIRFACDPD